MSWEQGIDGAVSDVLEFISLFNNCRVQPWKDFVSDLAFPQLQAYTIQKQILTNINYYLFNYIVLWVLVIIVEILFDPVMSAVYLFLFLINFSVLVLRKLRLNHGVEDPIFAVAIVFALANILFLLLSHRMKSVLIYNSIALSIVFLHSFLRKRSLKSRLAYKNSAFVRKEDTAVKELVSSLDTMEIMQNPSPTKRSVKNRADAYMLSCVCNKYRYCNEEHN